MVDSDIWSQILETQKPATTALHSAVCSVHLGKRPKHRISEKRMVAARNVSKSVVEQWSVSLAFQGELRPITSKIYYEVDSSPILKQQMSIFFTLLKVFFQHLISKIPKQKSKSLVFTTSRVCFLAYTKTPQRFKELTKTP